MRHHNGKSTWALALLATTFLTPPSLVEAGPGDTLGPEFQVNTTTTGRQWGSVVAMDNAGNFVVAWHGFGETSTNFDVVAQRYNSAGVPQDGEFIANSTVSGEQARPAVAMDADGDFVVVWIDGHLDASSNDIIARRFDAAGNPKGVEFEVNTFTTNIQNEPAVAMDADGDFVVVWQSFQQDGNGYGVFARRYSAAGEPQGTEFQVNTVTSSNEKEPAVAMDDQGNFVVAWQGFDGSGYGVLAQRYDSVGVAQGTEFQVNSTATGDQQEPAVAMDSDGDFVVAWGNTGIRAQRFDAAGAPQGPEYRVNSILTAGGAHPAIAMDGDGDFVVTWTDYSGRDGGGPFYAGVFGQRYDKVGTANGGEFLVNTFVDDDQELGGIALDADGDFVVVWDSYGQDGSVDGVFAQRFQGDGPVAGDFTVDGRADILWRNTANGNTNLWQMDGFDTLATGSIGGAGGDWQVRALADFNADTKTDVLWRNTATGSAALWLMDGYARLDSGGIGAASLDWEIAGAGDLDGDDHADILWRNITNGAALVWTMDGLSRRAVSGIGGAPLDWEVRGLGDVNADAKADILWRNTANGAAAVWLMDGFSRLASGGIGGAPLAWQVAGLGTFNSDARADILWRNTATGTAMIWKMNGLVQEAAQSIGAPPLIWRVEGVGDGDGDRQSDILWRNTGNGATLVWQMDGFVTKAVGGLGRVPLVWEAQ